MTTATTHRSIRHSTSICGKKPAVLVVWGKNDPVFAPAGAETFLKDAPSAELHLLDTGHFALEEDGAEIAQLIHVFLAKNVR